MILEEAGVSKKEALQALKSRWKSGAWLGVETIIRHLALKLGSERTSALLKLWSKVHARCAVVETSSAIKICRDPKDDANLGLCAAAEADVLITGGKDLLVVDPSKGPELPPALKILTPRQFLDLHG